MTAKEMLKPFKREHKLYNNENINYYEFLERQLKDFVNQLCKEQRELCAKIAWDIQYILPENNEYDELVRNAQQPEV